MTNNESNSMDEMRRAINQLTQSTGQMTGELRSNAESSKEYRDRMSCEIGEIRLQIANVKKEVQSNHDLLLDNAVQVNRKIDGITNKLAGGWVVIAIICSFCVYFNQYIKTIVIAAFRV